MFRKYILTVLAIGGVAIGVMAALRSARNLVPTPMVSDAPTPPYQAFVAGAGLVEANTENIAIGTQIAGIVSDIYVQIGSDVRKDDPLFTIDNRAQRALVASRQAAVQIAEPQLADAQYELKLAESLVPQGITIEARDRDRFAMQKAEALLVQARADLNSAQTDLERLTVRAPVTGQILQLKIRTGEFAQIGVLAQPLILMGNVQPLHVRVDVDENEAWRVRKGAPATGYLRGNKEINTPLAFVRFEPYVIPKVSLTGAPGERVDTRVMQVIYSFPRGELAIQPGQRMDIYIDALPRTSDHAAAPGNTNHVK